MVAYQQRRIHLGVAVLVGVEVEHELADRTLQPRQALLQDHKARAAQFCSGFEIHEAERTAEIVMRFRREAVVALVAEHVVLNIAVFVCAIRHSIERKIRNGGEFLGKLFVCRLRSQFELRHGGLELRNLSHQGSGSRLILCLFSVADFLRGRIAPRLRLLRFEDRRAALLVDREQRGGQRLQPAPF